MNDSRPVSPVGGPSELDPSELGRPVWIASVVDARVLGMPHPVAAREAIPIRDALHRWQRMLSAHSRHGGRQGAWRVLACGMLWLAGAASTAWAADPQLRTIAPPGLPRGGSAVLEFRGERVGVDPQQPLLARPGLVVAKIEAVDANLARVHLEASADAPLGIHPVRIRTASGLSNLLTLHVGALPEIDEQEPNSDFASPQPIDMDVTVRGVIQNEDVDYFVVAAVEGERLSVEVEGLRLGRTFFDPAIALLDENRFELAASDDAILAHQDPLVSLLVPQTGKYIVAVRETAFLGNDQCTYRLHVGRFPRPTTVFPPGGPPGATLEVRWIGDPKGEVTQRITLPSEVNDAHPLFFADADGVAPSPIPVRVNSLPNVLEVEPSSRQEPTVGEVPGAFCGIVSEPGEKDVFQFAARKGQVWDVRVFARQLRSPLDSVVRVLDAQGKRLAGNDDDQGRPDSFVQFRVPEDGDYLLEMEDHLRQGGPDFVYRIEVAPPRAEAAIRLDEQRRYVSQTIEVARGNRAAVMAIVARRNLGGPLQLVWDDLPDGLIAECPPLAADYDRVPVLFRAAPDAPLAATLARVTAVRPADAAEAGPEFTSSFAHQTWLIRGSNNVPVWNHMADRPPAAVTEEIPFTVEAIVPHTPLVQNGSKQLRVVATRREGFDGPIAIRLLFNPPGVSSNASRSIPKGQTEALIPITAAGNASIQTWDVIVVAEANGNGRVTAASEFVSLVVAAPYVNATFPVVTTEPGKGVEYPLEIEVTTPFAGEARLQLVGLPAGVTTEPQQIGAETTRAVFMLQVAAEARPGVHKNIVGKLTIDDQGEAIEHTLASGELRIDAPPQPEVDDASGP